MKSWSRLALTVVCILFLSATVPAAAHGGTIVSEIVGTYAGISPATGDLVTTFILTSGTVTSPTPLMGLPADDLLVDVTAFLPGVTDVDLNPTDVPPRFIIFDVDGVTPLAVYTLSNPAALDPSDPFLATGTITSVVSFDPVLSTIVGLDVSQLNRLEVRFAGLEVLPVSPDGDIDGLASWPVGGPVSATWRLFTVVPEPSSLALAGAGLAAFAVGCLRRRRARIG